MTTSTEVHCGHCALSIAEQVEDRFVCFDCGRSALEADLRDLGDYRIISANSPVDTREPLKRLIADLLAATEPDRALECRVATVAKGYVKLPPIFEGQQPRYGYRDGPGIVSPGQAPDMLVPHYMRRYDDAFSLAGDETNRRVECGTYGSGSSWAYAHLAEGEEVCTDSIDACNEPTAITAALLSAHLARLEGQAKEAEARATWTAS